MYYENLLRLCDNTLLHLYMSISLTGRFYSSSERNKILVKFLKNKVKLPEYKDLKKELQLMIRVGRNNDMKLEVRLIELKKISFIAVHGEHE
jgi:hypothetical protein